MSQLEHYRAAHPKRQTASSGLKQEGKAFEWDKANEYLDTLKVPRVATSGIEGALLSLRGRIEALLWNHGRRQEGGTK